MERTSRRRAPVGHRRGDQGQVVPVLALAVAIAVIGGLLLVELGQAAVDRAGARAAADAGALAAAAGGIAEGEELVRANGAEPASIERSGDRVVATATLDGAVGEAHALRIEPPPVEGRGSRAGLAPAMLAALARADQLLGVEVPITSGYRSPEHQRRLWENRASNPYPVARPGSSRHEQGLAVDVPLSFVPRLLSVATAAGLCQPLPVSDPIHFQLC